VPALGAGLACGVEAGSLPAGDELALFNEMPVVVSASRQRTAIIRSPVPVSVVTAEDLASGGHYQLAEALRFVPGVDVRRIDRNHYAVGVRGFHGSFSDRTLTLVDGRTADSPVFGGAEFHRLPLMIGDIDHVEVVRGPGGAAWGANAFNGVINIITRDPEDMLGVHASSLVSGFGDTATEVRWCDAAGAWSWKVGVFHQSHRSSSEALDDDTYPDNDWGRKTGSDNLMVLRINDATSVRAGIGYADVAGGAFEFLGVQPDGEDHLATTRIYAQLDQRLADDASYRFGWYGNFLSSRRPAVFDERSRENVIDFQFDYQGLVGHRLSLGADWRLTEIEVLNGGVADRFDLAESPYHEQRYGAFAIDRWQVAERLSLEGQLRGDRYDGTGSDWAGRVALLYGLDRHQHHILRLAAARAYRTPLPALRDATITRPPLLLIPSDGLDNEHTWSIETGYAADLPGDVMAQVNLYHQRYQDLIGFTVLPSFQLQASNLDGATGQGGEVELGWSPTTPWSPRRARVAAWYALNHLDSDQANQEIRAFTPGEHKVGANLRTPLPWDLAITVSYAFTSSSDDPDIPVGTHVGPHHQGDVTLAWDLPRVRGEVMIGVWDVFNRADEPVYATGTSVPHETPGRTVFVRGVLDF
jgi:iron complex outermembrane receptor protein